MTKKKSKKVSIIMGSQSDYKTMKFCEKVLKVLKINFETKIVSAHRTPNRMFKYARTAEKNNIKAENSTFLISDNKAIRDYLKQR